jgi:hypothetical protein
MKTAITILVAVVVGFGSGAYFNHVRVSGVNKMLAAERDQIRSELDQAMRAAEDNARQTEMLQRQLAALDDSFSQFMTTPPPPPAAMDATMMPPEMEETTADPAETRDRRQRDRQDATADGPGGGDREERRQAFAEQIRGRVDQFYQEQMQQAPDRDTQERLAAMQQYTDDLMALRTAMRDAQTDEDRQALRDSMGETFQALRQVQVDQQNAMLRDLATRYGITDQAAQDQFAQSLQRLQNSPFFRPERMFMGGGGPGGPGGPGMLMGGGFGGRGGR